MSETFFFIKLTITSEENTYYYLYLLIRLINSKKYLNYVYPNKKKSIFRKVKN